MPQTIRDRILPILRKYQGCGMVNSALDEIVTIFDTEVCSQRPPLLNKDFYTEFEKYTNCIHKQNNTIGENCRECDIAILISRCELLESCFENILNVIKGK
jgi:hypothetical protein